CKPCRQVFVAQNVEGSHANCAQLGALTITRCARACATSPRRRAETFRNSESVGSFRSPGCQMKKCESCWSRTIQKLAEAKREGEEHETASGHSLKAWWMFLQYIADETE